MPDSRGLRAKADQLVRANAALLLTAVASLALLVAPDAIFYAAGAQTSALAKKGSMALAAGLALGLTLIRGRQVRRMVLLVVLVSQAVWLGCLAYFGRPLGPEQLLLALNETRDVAAGIVDHLGVLLPALAVVGVCGALLWLVQSRELPGASLRTVLGGWLLAVLVVGMSAYWLLHRQIVVALPGAHTFSAAGPYQTGVAAIRLLLSPVAAAPGMRVAAASVTPVPLEEEPVTVVVVMGEGISPGRMSLFGFSRPTTPRLDAWRTNPPAGFELIAKVGLSGGVSTLGSVPAFLKMAYWPVEAEWRGVNLFDLAHSGGFKSWFLSAQSPHFLSMAGGARGAERVVTEQGNVERLAQQHDDMLLDLAREILADPQRRFVVLHQRVNHSNYTSHCSHLPASEQRELYTMTPADDSREEYRRAAYDNGTLCWDRHVTEVGKIFAGSRGAVHILITADHNEMMGENGLWGHSQPDLQVAQVPVLLLTNRPQSEIARRFRALSPPTWFELSQLVARALGADVSVPGFERGVFYMNTTMPFGRSGYFRVTTKEAGRFAVEYFSREGRLQRRSEAHLPLLAVSSSASN